MLLLRLILEIKFDEFGALNYIFKQNEKGLAAHKEEIRSPPEGRGPPVEEHRFYMITLKTKHFVSSSQTAFTYSAL